jgi:glucose/arabinose dehydrogenase
VDEQIAPKAVVEKAPPPQPIGPIELDIEQVASLDDPWAMAFEPVTGNLFVTETNGSVRLVSADGAIHEVSGAPQDFFDNVGPLGDIAFAPDYTKNREVYLSWVESGRKRTRGAAIGRGKLSCPSLDACAISDLTVIWRQTPKVTGYGHYSHRLIFSPDGQYLFVASGDRHEKEPAQNNSNTLGTIVRLNLDGTPAPGNPMAKDAPPTNEIWSFGHRNILGMAFDPKGRFWAVAHGPVGGDELNIITPGKNYGWPVVSEGKHYNGDAIPAHSTRPDLVAPALSWTPVIAPSGMIIYDGDLFAQWRGQALITGLKSRTLVRVELGEDTATEAGRYPMGDRMRAIAQAPDGAIWLAEEGEEARLLRLVPKK